jgi:cytochrome c-type biogenesis protein CcmH
MALTLLGWLLFGSSATISALLIFLLRAKGSRREQLDPEEIKARLEDIGVQLKLGKLTDAEADAARLALLARPQSSSWKLGQALRGTAGTLIVPVVVFLVIGGIGSAISYVGASSEAFGSGETNSSSLSSPGPDDEVVERLQDYTRSIATKEPAPRDEAGQLLPDVDTMIERLAARLETTPDDVRGWRMLGWSYFHTGRFEQAAAAFARAVELDPNSAELKQSYEEAKARAAENSNSKVAVTSQVAAMVKEDYTHGAEKMTEFDAMPAGEHDAAIRSMVEGLADRLEAAPRDVDGWTRLMRSRVVLGERELAATAYRKALEAFKDDSAASSKITAAAIELGLKDE